MVKTSTTAEAQHAAETPHNSETGEIATVAADTFAAQSPAIVVKNRVTVPTLKFEAGMTIVCRFLTAIAEGKELRQGGRGPKMAKAYVCRIQAANGDVRTMVAGTVLRAEMEENYPYSAYVGGWFQISKHPPKPGLPEGGQYSTYSIAEVYPPPGAIELEIAKVG